MTSTEPPAKRQRIAKLMARAGLCSRRDAEAWILDGRVSVNGTVIASPALDVGDDDAILVDGEPLPTAEKTRLFLFHKPRGLVTSDRDPEGRATVADYLREHWPEGPRVVTIGRLDINTEGLLLLTNDGGLARTLELPQTGWVRRYRVRAKGIADPAALDALIEGVTIDGVDYAGIEAKLDRTQGANSWLTMGLREGKNREIKRVLEHLGLEVNRLIRLSFGPFQLLDLEEGAVEEVKTRVLRDQLGEKLAQQAGVDFGEAPAPVMPPKDERRSGGKAAAGREKPARATRKPPGRASDRPPRRDEREALPVRERPTTGARKHVSTLRAAEAEDARKGPRKRIERTDTRDRRDRTVTVERLVSARAAPESAAGRPPRHRTDAGPFGEKRRPRPADGLGGERTRRDGARPRDEGRGERRHASPSALGKRERMSRSGGAPERSRGPRDDRPARDARAPRADRNERPSRDVDRTRQARPPRTDRATGPREDRRAGRGGGPRSGTDWRAEDARPKRTRPAEERHGRHSDERPRAGRPTGAASRKPNRRNAPPRGGKPGGRPAGNRPRGPSKPRT